MTMSKSGRLSRLFPKLFRGETKTKPGNSGYDPKGPFCIVVFLDDAEKNIAYKNNWKGQIIFDTVCEMLNILEKDYFGLRVIDNSGQTHWLDLTKSVSSQFKACSSLIKLYFCVKFYAADPCKLRDEITRYLFFLQVKRDILQGRLPVAYDDVAELCGYALQSELGDFDPRIHTTGYVSEFCFVPNQTEELEAKIAGIHRRCVGATPLMAEQKYLEKVKWLELYGVDLHPVQGESNVEYFLGLTPTGVVVYKHKTKVASYFWPRVTKAGRKGKMFTIRVKDKSNDEHVYGFELSTKSACKHLWKCCVEHHAFFSGRSQRLAASEARYRQQPTVRRSQSRRQARRSNSDSRLVEQWYNDEQSRTVITVMGQAEPIRAPRHNRSLPELQGRQSPRSVKSAPWESKIDNGLYTSGHDSPSVYSDSKYPGSDGQSGISHRKRYFPNTKTSDNESDASATRRRRRELDSDSGSEISFPNSGQTRKIRHTMSDKDVNLRSNGNLFYPYHDKENLSQGSIPSLHSAPAGEAKQRRRRRRSKSPGNSKRPPEELKQHIEFDLIDPEGMTEDQLRDIPYTKIETKASLFRVKYSPKLRHKIWASRRKSFGDVDKNSVPKTESNSTLSRQDSYYTDPTGKYVYGSRVSGSLSQGHLPKVQEPGSQNSYPLSQDQGQRSNPKDYHDGYTSSSSRRHNYNQDRGHSDQPVRQRNPPLSQHSFNEQRSISEVNSGYRNTRELDYKQTNRQYDSDQNYNNNNNYQVNKPRQRLEENTRQNPTESNRLSYSMTPTTQYSNNEVNNRQSSYNHSMQSQHQRTPSSPDRDNVFHYGSRTSRTESPRYRETLPAGGSSNNSTPSRDSNRVLYDQKVTTRPRSNYDSPSLSQPSYSGQSGPRNSYEGVQFKYNTGTTSRGRLQNTYNSYNTQLQNEQFYYQQSPRSVTSDSPSTRQSAFRQQQQRQQPKYSSNLVTQL